MPRLFYFFVVFVLLPFSPVATSGIYDDFLVQIKQELLIGNADAAMKAASSIGHSLDHFIGEADPQDLAQARGSFQALVGYWKASEAVYIAGVLDEEMIDHPRFIDHFHQGKVSVGDTLTKVLNSDKDLSRAMFKSSSKGINALEYLLFAEIPDSPRRWEAARVAAAHIESWLSEIADFYRDEYGFVLGEARSLEMIVNGLVDSSYRLANWRLGEPAGEVEKYRGKPASSRLEYRDSGFSLDAVDAILETHARVFEIGIESGLFTPEGRNIGLEEVAFVRQRIGEAQAALGVMSDASRNDPASAEFLESFRRVEALHKAYYLLLVDALKLRGRIVDADGD